ncbi:MAG: hypothetical protein ABS939_10815 [Psychrobacillus sp.]
MKVFVFEGSRGVGKTTQATNVRQKVSEITLVNPTGFHANGEKGLSKIAHYYDAWIKFIMEMSEHDSTLIFDRFFFSEKVFSMYKDYDFSQYYEFFLKKLIAYSDVTVLFFTINDEAELKKRLIRDKVPFGDVEESVEQTMKQQNEYREVLIEAQDKFGLDIIEIDTTGKTPEEIEKEVFEIVGGI